MQYQLQKKSLFWFVIFLCDYLILTQKLSKGGLDDYNIKIFHSARLQSEEDVEEVGLKCIRQAVVCVDWEQKDRKPKKLYISQWNST